MQQKELDRETKMSYLGDHVGLRHVPSIDSDFIGQEKGLQVVTNNRIRLETQIYYHS